MDPVGQAMTPEVMAAVMRRPAHPFYAFSNQHHSAMNNAIALVDLRRD